MHGESTFTGSGELMSNSFLGLVRLINTRPGFEYLNSPACVSGILNLFISHDSIDTSLLFISVISYGYFDGIYGVCENTGLSPLTTFNSGESSIDCYLSSPAS
jgi:hypothetical protein